MKKSLLLGCIVLVKSVTLAQQTSDTALITTKVDAPVSTPLRFSESGAFRAFPMSLNMKEVFQFSRRTPTVMEFKQPSFQYQTNFSVQPFENSYRFFPLHETAWIGTEHQSNHYFGLGGMTLVGANYNQWIGNSLLLTGGVYASKFNVYNNFYNSAGVNGNIKLRVSDRVNINLFGQYSATDNKRPIFMVNSLYPQSNYGGSIEFKVTDSWGIVTGAEREFDVMQRKWVTRPFILPVFYGH